MSNAEVVAPGLRHDYAEVNGVRFHYVVAGSGPLILFAHGFPEFWYAWKEQLAEFGRDHLAVAPDLRGYNLSAKPARVEHYAVRHLVEDLRALAAHLGHERFTLVGHDWGGVIAWAFALRHPDLLDRLVIVNAPHPAIFERELRENSAQRRASRYIGRLRDPRIEGVLSANGYAKLAAMILDRGGERGPFTGEDRAAYLAAWSQPGALTGALNYYRAMRLGPLAEEDADRPPPAIEHVPDPTAFIVHVPTLVIWGERDGALLPGNLDGLDAFVPDLRVERIPDGSHWVIHEHPARINALIREFIGR